jgi:5-methylcytosine-specific restriction endonuclease McrA
MAEIPADLDHIAAVIHSLFQGDPASRLDIVQSGQRDEINLLVRRGVWLRDGGTCRWCGRSERGRMVLDHIAPWSAGGSDRSDNLRVLCWDCNNRRSNPSRTPAPAAPVSGLTSRTT